MHYANGRAAKAGDVVRGKGYNVKYEITGLLLYANPGSTACNCQVAHVGPSSTVRFVAFPLDGPSGDGEERYGQKWPSASFAGVEASIEYGQLDAFVAIDPATGEILPAES